jgi:hypothetical protein
MAARHGWEDARPDAVLQYRLIQRVAAFAEIHNVRGRPDYVATLTVGVPLSRSAGKLATPSLGVPLIPTFHAPP